MKVPADPSHQSTQHQANAYRVAQPLLTERAASELLTFEDHRLEAVAQRKLIAANQNSPRQMAQRKLIEAIHNSPRQITQQNPGRVTPTMKAPGETMNSDTALDQLAQVNVERAPEHHPLQAMQSAPIDVLIPPSGQSVGPVVQLKLEKNKLNLVGEAHSECDEERRSNERVIASAHVGGDPTDNYWREASFFAKSKDTMGDDPELRFRYLATRAHELLDKVRTLLQKEPMELEKIQKFCTTAITDCQEAQKMFGPELAKKYKQVDQSYFTNLAAATQTLLGCDEKSIFKAYGKVLNTKSTKAYEQIATKEKAEDISKTRSEHMHEQANLGVKKAGIWKIGKSHEEDLNLKKDKKYGLTTMNDFQKDYYQPYIEDKEYLTPNFQQLYLQFLTEAERKAIKEKLRELKPNIKKEGVVANEQKRHTPIISSASGDKYTVNKAKSIDIFDEQGEEYDTFSVKDFKKYDIVVQIVSEDKTGVKIQIIKSSVTDYVGKSATLPSHDDLTRI